MAASCPDPLLERLAMPPFRPRPPWLGADLQTLRDTLRPVPLPPQRGQPIPIPLDDGGALLALFDAPPAGEPLGLVVVPHGLGGSSEGEGVRRLGWTLQQAGFGVLRLNLRGAGPGRPLARGTYAARCHDDLLPALLRARQLAGDRPLFGAGLSLGGTVLLNGVIDGGPSLLDGLVAVSSPLDLAECCAAIGRPRNRFYERWLLRRLRHQTLLDPAGLTAAERRGLAAVNGIRAFDELITAPRWGYPSVDAYYAAASPWRALAAPGAVPPSLPPLLIVQALDDPWVPATAAAALAGRAGPWDVILTPGGGHNGFHDAGGCWSDRLTARWLLDRLEIL